MHIGSLPWYIRGFMRHLEGKIVEGDVIIHNNPYYGASHSPDIAVAVPIFHDGELYGFAAVTAHVLDVGGSFPGINADAFDVYAEAKIYDGLRWYQAGELNEDLDKMIFDNVRTVTMNRGDMNAMMAACQLGRDRMLRLFQRYGADTVMSAAYNWMDYSENMLRAQIRALPDGEYKAPTGWLDDDARNRGVRLRVETKVIVEGDEITIDLTGSNAEVPTGYNVPYEGSLLVGAYYAVRTILLDEVTFPEHVPQNDGVFRPVKVIAPKGTIFNPTFPRACFSRFCQVQRVVDNTILALADALPEGVTAGNSAGIHFCAYSGFSEEMGEYWLYLEVNEGSYGGRFGKDAMDSVDNLMANTRNNPIEELDLRFPIRCDQYELRPEPAAPGRWRGGIGIIRRNRFLVDGVYSCEGDRQTDPPRGIFGGWDGLVASCRKNPDTEQSEDLPAKVTGIPFAAGEFIEFREPNAAGLRRSARPTGRGRAGGRPRRLHHDRAGTGRVRRRVRGRAYARGRRGGDGGAPCGAPVECPRRVADRLLPRSSPPARTSRCRSPATQSSAWTEPPDPDIGRDGGRQTTQVEGGATFRPRCAGPAARAPAVPLRRVRKSYEQVADQLRELIVSGRLAQGDRLPTEAALSREVGVSRGTVREALRLVAAQGLIRTTKGAGGGSYVTMPTVHHISESLSSNIALLADARDLTLEELIEVRILLEVPAARFAARRRTSEDSGCCGGRSRPTSRRSTPSPSSSTTATSTRP